MTPSSRLALLSIDRDLPVQRATLLSLMFLGSAALCVLAVLTAAEPGADAVVLIGTAVIGGVAGAVLWVGRRRPAWWQLQAGLLLYSLTVSVVAACSLTVNGITSLGPAVIVATAYAGSFYSRRELWLQMGVSLVGYVLGAVLAIPPIAPTPMLTALAAALVLGLVLNRLTMALRDRTLLDPLTGVLSRATWVRITSGMLGDRACQPLTVAMIDLDNFKQTNDTLGHLAGDTLLATLAAAWNGALIDRGFLGRYGGDEFVIVFPDTDPGTAEQTLAQLRQVHPARWTAGLATAEPGEDLPSLLHRADTTLRLRKSTPSAG